ncbi:Protein Mis18-alpha, variant 2 [Entomophthora muscae]|uniref:Protein Mis18-alpha, variant 2 n=1 Tax=Entomophthora muscae TaxID=34485 RepID=A0ACC2SJN6_9FUNG|nr:Protein Mis18-alpha, variant 2 [Entomophthora muscae]
MTSVNEEQGKEAEAEGVSNPYVTFCKGCRIIIADSFTFLGFEDNLKMAIFYDKSDEILCGDELNLAKDGIDSGSTFKLLTCSVCKIEIGRIYNSTPQALDTIRDCYAFYNDMIDHYILGPSPEAASKYRYREQIMDTPTAHGLLVHTRKGLRHNTLYVNCMSV